MMTLVWFLGIMLVMRVPEENEKATLVSFSGSGEVFSILGYYVGHAGTTDQKTFSSHFQILDKGKRRAGEHGKESLA